MMQMEMKRKTIIALASALLVSVGVAQAQEQTQEPDGFSKQIEIEKDYSTGVDRAERIEIEPMLLDTTIVRPQMRYSIVSVAQRSNFKVEKISPVGYSTVGWNAPENIYLNVGAGVPLQSELDLYWTPVQSRDRLLVVALNHEGIEAQQTTVEGERLSGLLLKNRLATHFATPLFGGKNNTKLVAEVDYQGVVANPYGGVGVVGERSLMDNNALRGDVKVSGIFNDTLPLSYTARLRGNYALADYAPGESAEDGSMWRFCVDYALDGLDSIKRWLPSRVTLYYYGVRSTGVSPYFDTSVTFVPEWNFRIGEWLPVNIMAGYDYMVYRGAVQSWRGLVGSVDVAWEKNPKLIPWVKISNDIDAGLLAPTLWNAPYHNLLPTDSRKIYRGEAGVKGALGAFAYELKGGFDHYSKYFYTQVLEGSPILLWGADAAGLDMWYAEGAFAWQPLRTLSVEGSVRWNTPRFHSDAAEVGNHAYSIRELTGSLAVNYSPLERLHLTLGAKATTATSAQLLCANFRVGEVEMPGYVDLGLRAEYDVNDRFVVWLRGDNLLNQDIYEWATYRQLGISGRVGVSVSF